MKVLLVDDEVEFVSTLAERLHMRGIEADDVNSGQAALSLVEQNQYDVVVLDLRMVGLDGLETMNRMKEMKPDSTIIILTGHCDEERLNLCREMGASLCLVKPINIEQLIENVKELIARKGLDK